MIEITLKAHVAIVSETLSRIGIGGHESRPTYDPATMEVTELQVVKTLSPTAYIYHNHTDNRDYLIHFKEWFLISRPNAYDNFSDDDRARLAVIAGMLRHWGLIECDPSQTADSCASLAVVPKAAVGEWRITHKIKPGEIDRFRPSSAPAPRSVGFTPKSVGAPRVTMAKLLEEL